MKVKAHLDFEELEGMARYRALQLFSLEFLSLHNTVSEEFHTKCAFFLQNKKGSPSKEVGTLCSDDLAYVDILASGSLTRSRVVG